MTPKRAENLYNFGTAAVWFGFIVFAPVAAWTLWDFWASLDTESLLIGANGFFGAALSMVAGVLMRTTAAAFEIARKPIHRPEAPR